jgi:DNA-binding HxlR family transcriptional regulator
MPRHALESSCPVEAMFRFLMGPWTMYILWTLRHEGPLRFGVLKDRLAGVSSKVLTDRLRLLERREIIFRDHKPTIPPEVTYGLTDHGKELGNALDSLEAVARAWEKRSKSTAPTSRRVKSPAASA